MTHEVVITRKAEHEMLENATWWAANRSTEQAARWLAGIEATLHSLANQPARFPLAPENDRFAYELRELHFGIGRRPTHRVIFTIAEDIVLVLTIRHTAQDELHPEDLI